MAGRNAVAQGLLCATGATGWPLLSDRQIMGDVFGIAYYFEELRRRVQSQAIAASDKLAK